MKDIQATTKLRNSGSVGNKLRDLVGEKLIVGDTKKGSSSPRRASTGPSVSSRSIPRSRGRRSDTCSTTAGGRSSALAPKADAAAATSASGARARRDQSNWGSIPDIKIDNRASHEITLLRELKVSLRLMHVDRGAIRTED